MNLIDNQRYIDLLDHAQSVFPHWKRINGKTFFISGASGLLGSFLVDVLMRYNMTLPEEERCRLIAACRNKAAAEKRFSAWLPSRDLAVIQNDVKNPLVELPWSPDYWVHGASTTDMASFLGDPINTVLTNILGTYHLLEGASRSMKNSRFMLLSSVEVYGENRGDTDKFEEDYCGYINCNSLRSSYPEGKRASETLCQAYIAQKNVDAVILRLPNCYGPTMRMSDTKTAAEFIKTTLEGKPIILRSAGTKLRSYAFVFDAVIAMLWVLLTGECGQAYNAADESSDVTIRQLADAAADCGGVPVEAAPPENWDRNFFSPNTLMDGSKLKALGWRPCYDIHSGMKETIEILQKCREE